MSKNLSILSAVFVLLMVSTAQSAESIWQDVSAVQGFASRTDSTTGYFQADEIALRNALMFVPNETSGDRSHQIRLPMPDGSLASFSVVESPIMTPRLADQYPEIKTFRVFGVDDKHASGRIDITQLGLHGMIDTSQGSVYINPQDFKAQNHVYLSRYKSSDHAKNFRCGVHSNQRDLFRELAPHFKTANRVPGNLIQYRLAVAATFEYHNAVGSSTADTLAAIVSTISNVNFIYERDLGVQLLLVNDDAIYETVDNDELNNNNELILLGQVNDWIDNNLPGGDAAYDIGHIFSVPRFTGGGVANLGAVCNDLNKAGGVSGSPVPLNNLQFDIDLVAHEIGHQFNANHSFNGTTSSCINRNAATGFEPGSGSTIMAYAGICVEEDLQPTSDATFHAGSIAQINSFTAGAGNCFNPVPTVPAGNTDPSITSITPIPGKTIPANTPFVLEGKAIDGDGNALRYQWDQMDTGCPTNSTSFGTDNGSNPLFRSYLPRPGVNPGLNPGVTWRNFPALGTQVEGKFDKAEVMPCQNRDLDFRLTTRDGQSGQVTEDVRISVSQFAGPFQITNVNLAPTLPIGIPFEITWDIANTHLPPVSCTLVDFDLISFSSIPSNYATYSIHPLVAATNNLNDGDETVLLKPINAAHTRSRVRVKCRDNIFYDISDTDLTITATGPPLDLGDTDYETYFYQNDAITSTAAPVCGPVVNCGLPPITGGGGSSGHRDTGAFDYMWLLLLAGLAGARHWLRRQG